MLQIRQGSTYPALHRLDRQRLDQGPLGHFGKKPPRKILRTYQSRTRTARTAERCLGRINACRGPGAANRLGERHAPWSLDRTAPRLTFESNKIFDQALRRL